MERKWFPSFVETEYENVPEFAHFFFNCIGHPLGNCKREDQQLENYLEQTNPKPKPGNKFVYISMGEKLWKKHLTKMTWLRRNIRNHLFILRLRELVAYKRAIPDMFMKKKILSRLGKVKTTLIVNFWMPHKWKKEY